MREMPSSRIWRAGETVVDLSKVKAVFTYARRKDYTSGDLVTPQKILFIKGDPHDCSWPLAATATSLAQAFEAYLLS